MSLLARTHQLSRLFALAYAINADRKARVGSNVHYSPTVYEVSTPGLFQFGVVSQAVSQANATDLATSLTLAREIRQKLIFAAHDDVAHKTADLTFDTLPDYPTDLATCITFANSAKAKINTHIASTTYHANADATNTISSVNATDQASVNTLLNEIKTDWSAHTAAALGGYSVRFSGG